MVVSMRQSPPPVSHDFGTPFFSGICPVRSTSSEKQLIMRIKRVQRGAKRDASC